MAFSHGTNAVLKVGDSGGTLRDLSAYLTQETLQRTAGAEQVTTQGKTAQVYIPGLADGTIPLEGNFDPTVDGYLAGIVRVADRSFEYYPAGEPVGATKPKYSGLCMLTSYEIATGISGKATFRATLQLSDTVTRAVA